MVCPQRVSGAIESVIKDHCYIFLVDTIGESEKVKQL